MAIVFGKFAGARRPEIKTVTLTSIWRGVPTKHLYVENEERKAKLLVLSDQRTTVRNEETTAI
jgi:hypothetical protein